jgi:hypothetical protein
MVDYAIPETLQPDVRRWLEQRQSNLHVTTTTITPAGQILDWVPIESQTSEPIAEPPPAVARHVHPDPARPTKPVRVDIGEAGPAGHVPILRPDLTRISSPDELERVNSKAGGRRVNPNRGNTKPADPDPAGYFHALSFQQATLYGADARLNVWDPAIDIPLSLTLKDHSISQLWLESTQSQRQTVEGGWTVDLLLNGDSFPHLFTYYTTNNYTKGGNNLGGYNRLQEGWIQVHPSIFPGMTLIGTSRQGMPQFEIGIKYQNFWATGGSLSTSIRPETGSGSASTRRSSSPAGSPTRPTRSCGAGRSLRASLILVSRSTRWAAAGTPQTAGPTRATSGTSTTRRTSTVTSPTMTASLRST